jgi:wyosine [tRNA(Phe)-imidazoG37] synthetase (radical SAM superfamily)
MVSQKPRPNRQSHVFGPVPSRRLGLSLGIDLVPFKTCTFDCIYCQLGRTTHKTVQRKEYVPVSEILDELEHTLKRVPRPDFITLSGSGEPTLHLGLRDIILGVRGITSLPVAVITNSSLLNNKEVREGCSLADVVLPSLDAGDEETFAAVNRPAPGLTFQAMLEGLTAFRRDFDGRLWLEVFLVRSVTDNDPAVKKIAHAAASARPDRIHLNTAVRPPAEEFVQPVPVSDLERYADFFKPRAEFTFPLPSKSSGPWLPAGQLLEALKRRPCTLEDMSRILNIPPVEITKYIDGMVAGGQLVTIRRENGIYYSATAEVSSDTKKLKRHEQKEVAT